MDFDKDKVDEMTLALLYLVICEREEGFGGRAWKSFDWDTLNRLHEKGLLMNPVGKAKSVRMTEEGIQKAEALFVKHFGSKLAQARLAVSEIRRGVKQNPKLTTSDVEAEIKAVRAERKRLI
jgi:Domain of unknown function (DUF6429)